MKHALILLFTLSVPCNAALADQCKDVLINAVFDVTKVNWDRYTMVAAFSNLSNFVDKRKAKGTDVTVPIYGVPVTLGHKDASKVKAKSEQQYDFEAVEKDTGSLLLMSGQANILDAWTTCMANRGGLGLRIQPLDKTQLILHLVYHKRSGSGLIGIDPGPITIADDVYIPDQFATKTNGGCLQKGKVYQPGDTCKVQLVANDAWATAAILVNVTAGTGQFTEDAYIAPRTQLRGKPRTVSVTADQWYSYAGPQSGPLKCVDAAEEEVFVEDTIRLDEQPAGLAVKGTTCKAEHTIDAAATRFCVRSWVNAPGKGDHYCTGSGTIMAVKPYWDPPKPANATP